MLHTEDDLINREIEMERKKIIYMALKSLNPKHELIIRLKYWQNLPHKKIAAIVNTTPNCVGVTLNTIRGNLEEKLQNKIKV